MWSRKMNTGRRQKVRRERLNLGKWHSENDSCCPEDSRHRWHGRLGGMANGLRLKPTQWLRPDSSGKCHGETFGRTNDNGIEI